MRMIGAGALMLLSGLSCAAPCMMDERMLREECSANSQAGIRECLERQVVASEQAIRDAEGNVKNALGRWDEDKKYADLARKRAVKAAQAFKRNREAQCEFAAALGGGAIGNALDIRKLACVAELNFNRAKQLEYAASNLTAR